MRVCVCVRVRACMRACVCVYACVCVLFQMCAMCTCGPSHHLRAEDHLSVLAAGGAVRVDLPSPSSHDVNGARARSDDGITPALQSAPRRKDAATVAGPPAVLTSLRRPEVAEDTDS